MTSIATEQVLVAAVWMLAPSSPLLRGGCAAEALLCAGILVMLLVRSELGFGRVASGSEEA